MGFITAYETANVLGHASVAMTLDVYADLFDDDLDTLAGAVPRQGLDSPPARPPRRG